ncbi:MAG: hypothetical protein BGP06_01445 [Rhizobiales bacterium 65-9]|nr:hypothetical protein [Hyphomicrobiales bacterium]OJY37628.1 MAG: hypothetical protein BGP06_01445 [Rhizobiales bacterium 65-9]
MSKLRFASARDVFEAFPAARDDIQAPPVDEAPFEFLGRLLQGRAPEDAIGFCAYLLGRRETVWWASQSHRTLGPPVNREDEKALLVAEAWVREPEEHRRRAALDIGLHGDHSLPGVWVSLAAGGSGGVLIISGQLGPPVAPEMTAKSARAAVLISLARLPIRQRAAQLPICVDICRRLAQDKSQPS